MLSSAPHQNLSIYGYCLETSIEIFLHQNGYHAFSAKLPKDEASAKFYYEALGDYIAESRIVVLDLNLQGWSIREVHENLFAHASPLGVEMAICHPLKSPEEFQALDEYEQLRHSKVMLEHDGVHGVSLEDFLENLIASPRGGKGAEIWGSRFLEALYKTCNDGSCYPLFIAIDPAQKRVKTLSVDEMRKLAFFNAALGRSSHA
ncbi:MAG: hypothetical protein GXX07_06090 [Wolinella succinogenes]|uniref:hypothetical protein n=1 Tax=Wolinella succinogenes TaxID=844 RepID=UPI00169ADC7F|nr:hypothetical protein [Wolinella succinogenes]NLU34524.1 hypothetical protein [Wolinella succinogenes]